MRPNYSQFLWIILLFPTLFCSFKIVNSYEASPKSSTNKIIKSLLKKMVFMEGGTFTMGNVSMSEAKMTLADSTLFSTATPSRVSIDPNFMSSTEITNGEWREFYQDKVAELGEARSKREFYPDTSLWIKEFPYSFNKPMADNYFSHENFDSYPVVGISWDQAITYCLWRSKKLNSLLKKIGIDDSIEFRLPTEAEWEYAAIKRKKKVKYMKELTYPWAEVNGLEQINIIVNFGKITDVNNVILKQYVDDGCLYTCEVASYTPTDSGIYNMGGNVSEWTSDQGFVTSFDFESVGRFTFKKLENLYDVEEEIKLLQDKLESGNQDVKISLDRLKHDRLVFTNNNLKICKGGNWANGIIYAQTASRQGIDKDKPSTKIGFRIAISNVSEDVKKYFPKKRWKP